MGKFGLLTTEELATMDLSDVLIQIQMTREKYLSMHKAPITQGAGKDQRWSTRVPDASKSDGRRIIRKATKEEVENEVINYYMALEKRRVLTVDKAVKVADYFLHWIDYKGQNKSLASETFRRYRNDYKRFILYNDFGQLPVIHVDYIDIEEFLIEVTERLELKHKAVATLFGYLNGMFKLALRERLIRENPCNLVDLQNNVYPFCNRTVKPDSDRILSNDEMTKLKVRVHQHQQDYPTYMPDWAIEICMWTGLRVGEVVALRWSDIDAGEFNIKHSEHRIVHEDGPDTYVIGATKNQKERRVPIGKELSRILFKIRQVQKENGIVSDFIVADKNGRVIAPTVSKAMYRRGVEAGIGTSSIHAIRRTVSSRLNTYYDRATVSHIMGHTEEVNQDHYDYDTVAVSHKQDTMDMLYAS